MSRQGFDFTHNAAPKHRMKYLIESETTCSRLQSLGVWTMKGRRASERHQRPCNTSVAPAYSSRGESRDRSDQTSYGYDRSRLPARELKISSKVSASKAEPREALRRSQGQHLPVEVLIALGRENGVDCLGLIRRFESRSSPMSDDSE